jgi:hypothetical protein
MRWARILKITGGLAVLLGTLDPMEGSVLILAGSGLIALGMFLSKQDRRTIRYWVCAFALIAIGVAALFGLSAMGGIGGKSGHSLWWGLLILPYPTGWLLAVTGGIAGLVHLLKARWAERA